MEHYINLGLRSAFLENMALAYFLGMCSFLACAKKVDTAMGLGLAIGAGSAAAQNPIVFKFGTQTQNDVQHEYMKLFKTKLEAATKGKVRVDLFPASQLGPRRRLLTPRHPLPHGTPRPTTTTALRCPGTEPRMRMTSCSGSTPATRIPTVVTRQAPMWPAMRRPG